MNISIPENPKVLIAYYSYTGNTENAAEILHEMTGADLARIEMQNPYRGNIYEVSQRDLNNGVLPPLTTKIDDMASYDVILLGFPTWWATLPPPVMTFLSQYDFSGKTIVPFNSNGGTKFGDSVSDLAKMTPGAYIAYGTQFFYSGGGDLEDNLSLWLNDNGLSVIVQN